MPKLRHSWPFMVALLGNGIFLQEIFVSGIYQLTIDLGMGIERPLFVGLLFITVSLGVYGVCLAYLLKRKFQGDLRWMLAVAGALPCVWAICFIVGVLGEPNMNVMIMYWGVYCLFISLLYGIRQWKKPNTYKTRFSTVKNIFVGIVFGLSFFIGMLFLVRVVDIIKEQEIVFQLFAVYLIIIQLTFPIALFFSMMDHHAYEQGQVKEVDVADLIEELGQKKR